MRIAHWSVVALLAGAAACSSTPDARGVNGGAGDGTNADGDPASGDGNTGIPGRDGNDGNGDGSGSEGDAGDGLCEKFTVRAEPTTADMLIVLDRSGSMKRDATNRWDPSVSAVQSVTSKLENAIRFGLMMFPSTEAPPIPTDPLACILDPAACTGSCADGILNVPIADKNAGAIANVLNMTQPSGGTPTGGSLQAALKVFGDLSIDPDAAPHPKFVLLVSDGQPTCPSGMGQNVNQGDIDLANSAVDALFSAGVKTYVIGYDTKADAALAGVLDEFAKRGGTDTHRAVEDEQSLLTEFEKIAGEVVSCSFQLGEEPKDPSYVLVKLDDQQLNLDEPDGWTITGKTVTVQGASCAKLQDGGNHKVNVEVLCEVVVPI